MKKQTDVFFRNRSIVATKTSRMMTSALAKEILETAISEYVFEWYNQVRPHASNGYKTPNEIRNA